jgi:hypothetical protein
MDSDSGVNPVAVLFAGVLGAASGYLFLGVPGAAIGLVLAVVLLVLSASDVV